MSHSINREHYDKRFHPPEPRKEHQESLEKMDREQRREAPENPAEEE
jgi:hypothetical protein